MSFGKKNVSVESWVIKLDRGLTEAEKAEFEALTAADPAFAAAVEESQKPWDFIKGHASELSPDLLADLETPARPALFGWNRYGLGWAAAVLAVACLLFGLIGRGPGQSEHRLIVEPGQSPLTKRFEDGSLARINSGSELIYAYAEKGRFLQLIRGEAQFEVVSDPQRPFVVRSGEVVVQAVGTIFNVRLGSSEVGVIVTEGKVEIKAGGLSDSAKVEASGVRAAQFLEGRTLGFLETGKKAAIRLAADPAAVVMEEAEVDIEEELKWRESLLTFRGPTLRDLASEFERKTGLALLIDDPKLDDVRIVGGAFSTRDPYQILNLLQNHYGISWQQVDATTIRIGGSEGVP